MNRHKQLSVRFLRANQPDALAVYVPNQKKAPEVKTDFSGTDFIVRSNNAIKKLEEGENSLQPGVVFKGRWIDVDLDEKNLILEAALDNFLQTPFVFGRKSKPRSHFLVMLEEPFERHDGRFQFMKSVRALGLQMELRGHNENVTNHTNLPGGQHESGESVTWHRPDKVDEALSLTPPITQTPDFARALRKAIISATLVDYWSEGGRHELALGLAGMLAKNYKLMVDNEEAPEAIRTLLDEKDCESILNFVCDQVNDTEKHDRILASRSTWKKENLSNIAGYDKLVAVMGEEKARLLRVAIAGSTFMDTVEKYNQMVAYHPQMMAYVMLHEIPKYGVIFRSFNEYMQHLPSHLIPLPGKKEKMVHAAKVLRMLEVTRNIDDTDFLPEQPTLITRNNRIILNNFRGWRCPILSKDVDENDSDIQFVKEHILKVVANGNEQLAHWILSWFADIYQQPNSKPGTSLVLVGRQGAGKSSLSGILGGALGVSMGDRPFDPHAYFMETSDIDRVMGKFNDHMEGTLLVQLEEVIQSGSSRALSALATSSRLKDMITKNQDWIEAKGLRTRAVPNYTRYILTSNSLTQAARIESYDRRYTVSEVNPDRANDLTYWEGEVFSRIADEIFHAKVFNWLSKYKYDKKFIQRPYETAAKKRTRDATAMRDEAEAELNFLVYLAERPHMPFQEGTIGPHWEVCTEKSLEFYNKVWSKGTYTDTWPEFISGDLWERAYMRYLRENMKINAALPPQKIFFLPQYTEIEKIKRNVKWTTRDSVEQRKKGRRNLIKFPTRRQILEIIKSNRPDIDESIINNIKMNIKDDENYAFEHVTDEDTEF